MDLNIRKIKKEDINSVYELLKLYRDFNDFKLNYYTSSDFLNEVFSKKSFVKLFVADLEGEIIGFILFNQSFDITGRAIFIEDNFVIEKYRGKKVGSSLFSKVLEYALANKIKKIKWSIKERDAKFKSLYKEIGAVLLDNKITYSLTESQLKELSNKKNEFDSELFKIRKVKNRDLPSIKYFIEEEIEKLDKNTSTVVNIYDLMKYSLGEKQLFKMKVLEVNDEIIGLITYFNYFSAFYGKALHIQWTFMKDEFKNIGVGKVLNVHLINRMAKKNYNILTIDINSKDIVAKKRMQFFGANLIKGDVVVEMDNNTLRDLINIE